MVTSVGTKPASRLFLVAGALVIAGALPPACTRSPGPSGSAVPSRAAESPRPAGSPVGNASRVHLVCPTFGPSPVPATSLSPSQGGHRVILSWRASAPADSKHADAVGYCIYRGTERKDPRPVLINSAPFPGTSCTDDTVENGKKYYYVVRAISAKGVTSLISNSAPAPIPTRDRTEAVAPGKSAPFCRETAMGK
jgi:hypothetical protein